MFDLPNLRPPALVFTDGTAEPPRSPGRNLNPDWVTNEMFQPLYGTIGTFQATDAWMELAHRLVIGKKSAPRHVLPGPGLAQSPA